MLKETLEHFENMLNELQKDAKDAKSILVSNSTWINQMRSDLYGNGKKGALTRIEELEANDKENEVHRAKLLRIDKENEEHDKQIKQLEKKIAYATGLAVAGSYVLEKILTIINK